MSRATRQNTEDAAAAAMARDVQALNEARVAFEAERSEHEQRTVEEADHIRREREEIRLAHEELQAAGDRQQEALTAAAAGLQVKLEHAEQAQAFSSSPASAAAGSSSPPLSQDTIVVDILKAIKTFSSINFDAALNADGTLNFPKFLALMHELTTSPSRFASAAHRRELSLLTAYVRRLAQLPPLDTTTPASSGGSATNVPAKYAAAVAATTFEVTSDDYQKVLDEHLTTEESRLKFVVIDTAMFTVLHLMVTGKLIEETVALLTSRGDSNTFSNFVRTLTENNRPNKYDEQKSSLLSMQKVLRSRDPRQIVALQAQLETSEVSIDSLLALAYIEAIKNEDGHAASVMRAEYERRAQAATAHGSTDSFDFKDFHRWSRQHVYVPEAKAARAFVVDVERARDRSKDTCGRCGNHHKTEKCFQWQDRQGNWLKDKSPAEPPAHVRLRRDAEILRRDKDAVANKAVVEYTEVFDTIRRFSEKGYDYSSLLSRVDMLLHTVESVARSHDTAIINNWLTISVQVKHEFDILFSLLSDKVTPASSVTAPPPVNAPPPVTGDTVVLSATVRPAHHPAKAVLDTGAGATLTMNSNNHTSLDESITLQVSGFDDRPEGVHTSGSGPTLFRVDDATDQLRHVAVNDGNVCPHLSRDLLSVGRMVVNQGYKLFLSPTKCELTTPEGFDIPLVFDSKFLLTFMNQHLPYPQTESVFYTREKTQLYEQITYFVHCLFCHSLNFSAIRATLSYITDLSYNGKVIAPHMILSKCQCSQCAQSKIRKSPMRRQGRALQLTADVSPVDSLHDRPTPEPLELDDYFFDDDDVIPTEFTSANPGTEVKIKFEDDELVFLTKLLDNLGIDPDSEESSPSKIPKRFENARKGEFIFCDIKEYPDTDLN